MVLRFLQKRMGGRAPDVETLKARADTARLVGALRHPDPGVREASSAALGKVGDLRAAPALIEALNDDEWTVRRAGVRALGCLLDACAEAQPPPTVEKQQNSAPGPVSIRSPQRSSEQTGGDSLSKQMGVALVNALCDEVWQVREAAAETLAVVAPRMENQAPRALLAEALLASLGDERQAVRRAAAGSLASLGSSHLGSLSAALNDTDWPRREGAVVALGLMGQESKDSALKAQTVTILVAALSDPDPRLRLAAVRALGQVGQNLAEADHRRQIVDPLTTSLQDQDGQIRESAARALGRIGDARAAGPLVDLLQDPKESVQSAAAQALDRLARAQGIQTGPVRSR